MTFEALIASGRAAGHTHITFHVQGRGQQTVELESAPQSGEALYARTGFPRYVNYNRHAYAPSTSGVQATPDGYLTGLTQFAGV